MNYRLFEERTKKFLKRIRGICYGPGAFQGWVRFLPGPEARKSVIRIPLGARGNATADCALRNEDKRRSRHGSAPDPKILRPEPSALDFDFRPKDAFAGWSVALQAGAIGLINPGCLFGKRFERDIGEVELQSSLDSPRQSGATLHGKSFAPLERYKYHGYLTSAHPSSADSFGIPKGQELWERVVTHVEVGTFEALETQPVCKLSELRNCTGWPRLSHGVP
ncbi:hypothetical protein KM043_004454 [Ampulex compressa]|nr:hypothetical protein KM043_004454 [Ampulex compressa]